MRGDLDGPFVQGVEQIEAGAPELWPEAICTSASVHRHDQSVKGFDLLTVRRFGGRMLKLHQGRLVADEFLEATAPTAGEPAL